MSSSLYGGQGSAPSGQLSNRNNTGYYKEKVPSGYRKGSIQNFSPEQVQQFQQLFGNVGPDSYLSKLAGGDQSTFDQMEAPALRQFNELQGGLASRFSGFGGQGSLSSRHSSGFQNAANQQASNFAQQLQSQRQGLQRNALSDLFNMSNILLGQRPMENYLAPKQQGTNWAQTIGQLGGFVPGLISSFAGGGSAGDAFKGASQVFGGGNGGGSYSPNSFNVSDYGRAR
jgi:hypothetical protein